MNWNEYQRFLDQKLADAQYNLEFAEKKLKESKKTYSAVLREKALNELVGEKVGE